MDPSKYQVASSHAVLCREGGISHLKEPSSFHGRMGTLSMSKPLVCNRQRLSGPSVARKLSTAVVGFGHPEVGKVLLQLNLWRMVPGCCKHNWQSLESMAHFATAAFLICGHCPPHMAEDSCDAHRGSQLSDFFAAAPLPLSKGAMAGTMLTTMFFVGPVGVTSQNSGTSPGRIFATRARRHLFTDSLQAMAIAAGESMAKDQHLPTSSTASWAEGICQPILSSVAISW